MMAITTMLAFVYARHAWGWSPLRATVVFGCFLALDLTFLSANLLKSRWRMVSDLGQRRLCSRLCPLGGADASSSMRYALFCRNASGFISSSMTESNPCPLVGA
jgi:hypothetical protein